MMTEVGIAVITYEVEGSERWKSSPDMVLHNLKINSKKNKKQCLLNIANGQELYKDFTFIISFHLLSNVFKYKLLLNPLSNEENEPQIVHRSYTKKAEFDSSQTDPQVIILKPPHFMATCPVSWFSLAKWHV